MWRLCREGWSLLAYFPIAPDPSRQPQGHGQVALVIPAFLTTDAVTRPLRDFLTRCGYRALGWELGINWGPTPRLLAGLRARLSELNRLAGGPVSVIGVSLGGILARDLAHDRAGDIRQLITVVSPCRLPTASTLEPLFGLVARSYSTSLDLARFATPLRVPGMSIYTRDDGIVAWESCRDDNAGATALEVSGQHLSICRNPAVLRAIAERLAATASAPSSAAAV
jgi:pimeloyl-ACP methyl ester carboxylesterase